VPLLISAKHRSGSRWNRRRSTAAKSGGASGTLYPGVHLVTPLIDSVALYDTREQVYTTSSSAPAKPGSDLLTVQAREGLVIGVAVSVR